MLAIPVLGFLVWRWGLFLLSKAGYSNPEELFANLALFLVLLFAVLPVSAVVGWLLTIAISRFREPRWAHEIKLRELDITQDKQRAILMTQPQRGDSRLTEEQRRLRSLLIVVMDTAYMHIASEGQYRTVEGKPWSRDSSMELSKLVPGYSQNPQGWWPVARKVRPWLQERGVLEGDRVSEDYLSRSQFYALLESEFYAPISLSSSARTVGRF